MPRLCHDRANSMQNVVETAASLQGSTPGASTISQARESTQVRGLFRSFSKSCEHPPGASSCPLVPPRYATACHGNATAGALLACLVLAVAVLLTGCSEWVPDSFPVTIDMDSNLSDQQVEDTVAACEELNTAVGERVLKPVSGNGRIIQRGRIHISAGGAGDGNRAVTNHSPWTARIKLASDAGRQAILHEVLHSLGLEHVADPTDVMFIDDIAGKQLKAWEVQYVRDMVEGSR